MFLQNNDQGQKIGMSRSQVIYKWYQFITGPLFVSFDQLSGKSIFYYSLIFFWVLLEAAPNVSDGSPIFFEKCMKSAGVWEISDTFNWKNTSTCFILILTEDLNNSSDLLSISRNFLQQNRLILVWMVWIIINFYIVFLQSDFFKQNIDFFLFSVFRAGKKLKDFRKSSNRITVVPWLTWHGFF